MREDLLHFIWNYKKLQLDRLVTTKQQKITIIDSGYHNLLEGPDFFNAKMEIDNQLWAGNVELHVKSSDWYAHHHESDLNYNAVILHVVWEHDMEVFTTNNSAIPTLELKEVISAQLLENYKALFSAKHNAFIKCEKRIATVDSFVVKNWLDRLFVERLTQKTIEIQRLQKITNNNWEQMMFVILARSFGTKINADAFEHLALSFDFSIVRKLRHDAFALESLFLGMAGLLASNEKVDSYYVALQKQFYFQKSKFSLTPQRLSVPAFFKLRPANFPTIRLSQLAALYAKHATVFKLLITLNSIVQIREVLSVKASEYWSTHYTFGTALKASSKVISNSFVNIIVLNAIIPLRFAYGKYTGSPQEEAIFEIVSALKPEVNAITKGFALSGIKMSDAKESQAGIELYQSYCTQNKCLQCAIGMQLLNRNG